MYSNDSAVLMTVSYANICTCVTLSTVSLWFQTDSRFHQLALRIAQRREVIMLHWRRALWSWIVWVQAMQTNRCEMTSQLSRFICDPYDITNSINSMETQRCASRQWRTLLSFVGAKQCLSFLEDTRLIESLTEMKRSKLKHLWKQIISTKTDIKPTSKAKRPQFCTVSVLYFVHFTKTLCVELHCSSV